MKSKLYLILLGLVIAALAYSHFPTKPITNGMLLKFSQEEHQAWMDNAFEELMALASQENENTGDCIKNWYYGRTKEHTALLIRNFMETYKELESNKTLLVAVHHQCDFPKFSRDLKNKLFEPLDPPKGFCCVEPPSWS